MPAKIVVKVFGGDPVEAMHPAFEPQMMTFALRDGELMHVDEVANGLGCGCLCPSCGEALIAKQGTKSAHHFAHKGGGDCKGGLETALHLAAKAILCKEMSMRLPELTVTEDAADSLDRIHKASRSIASKMVLFDEVIHEVRLSGVVPDILAKKDGRTLLIEIAVHHFVDEIKLGRLREMNVACVEVDLSGMIDGWTWDSLRAALVEGGESKVWIYNPRELDLRAAARLDAENKARQKDQTYHRQRAQIVGFEEAAAKLDEMMASGKFERYRSITEAEGPSHPEWISAAKMLALSWDQLPDHINIPVHGEMGFLVDRRVWQAGLCSWIRKCPNKSFSMKSAVKWCLASFGYQREFAVLQKNNLLLSGEQRANLPWASRAVSLYLRALSDKGRLRAVHRIFDSRYEIVLRK